MVERRNDLALQQRVDLPQIDGKAGLCVDFALHLYLEDVIMPVPMRIVTRAEALTILRIAPLRTVVAVRSREADYACESC